MVQIKIKLIAILFLLLFTNLQAQDTTRLVAGPSAESIAEVNALLKESYRHLATPYISGGKTPGGFDCSGFVRHCYSSTLGIKTPASSHEYNRYGVAVNIDDCRPGDVICFNGSRIGSRIGHVGIITEVSKENIYFIHSAIRGGIRFDQLNAPYYRKRFVGIRRIIL